MLAASVARKSRKFSSKIPHISACQELAARAFSAGSDDKKDIDTRHNVSYRPPRAGYAWMSEYQSGFATVSSPVSFLDSPQHVRAIANFCSPRLSREGAALFLDEGRLMQSSVLYKGPRMDTMTHQAMRRIVLDSELTFQVNRNLRQRKRQQVVLEQMCLLRRRLRFPRRRRLLLTRKSRPMPNEPN